MTTKISNFLMKQEVNKIIKQAIGIMGEDADILIVIRKNKKFCTAKHGDTDNIAQALFSCMHYPGNSIGEVIYKIIKLNVMNIFTNTSSHSYATDLIKSINNIIPSKDE